MKKRRLFISIMLAIFLISTVLIIARFNYLSNYLNIFENNWNRSFPKEAALSEVYSANSGASFNGDGIRYHVYSYKPHEALEQSFNWKKEDIAPIYHESIPEAAEDWLDSINVPSEKRPDYNECSYTYFTQDDNSELILFKNSIRRKLYIIESFR